MKDFNEKIAILIPCYNEELTIKKVIDDFKTELPNSVIYVYDNNSTDNTSNIAKSEGAIVVYEKNQGKGNVVRSMFRDIDADIYVMVDGDDTYPANEAYKLIDAIRDGNDMAIGDRLSSTYFSENERPFHNFGNELVRWLVNKIFNSNIQDIMTGYRAFSKRFVKTNAIMSPGFQIETELTILSLEYRYNIKEIPIQYRDRPSGSESKLNTISDGIKVLITLFDMFKDHRPLLFFSFVSLFFVVVGLLVGVPVIVEFCMTNYVSKIPSAVLSSSLITISIISIVLGIILDHQTNIDKKKHELNVIDWVERNEKNK